MPDYYRPNINQYRSAVKPDDRYYKRRSFPVGWLLTVIGIASFFIWWITQGLEF